MVLENSQFNQSIKGTNAQLRLAQSELRNASTSVGVFGKDSERLGSVQQALGREVELHSQKVDLYKKSIEETSTKMNDNIKERDKLGSSLEKANKKYDEAVKLYGKESEQAKKAKEEVDRLTEEYNKKEKAIESNAKQIQRYETNMNKAEAQMSKTEGELKKINEELARSNNKWIQASKALQKSGDNLKRVGGQMENAGDKVLKFSAPFVGAGVASLKFSNDYENAVAKVSTISDEGEVSIGELSRGILKLSDDTGIASTAIAEDTYQAISAGQATGNAVNFVRENTKLAKAGFAETGDSLDLLTTILNAYKLESQDVGRVSDMLITTQNKGKISVAEMSQTMGKLIPTAVATNTGLEQVATGYAVLTKNGIKSAEATTYFSGMLNELSKNGSKADLALREVSGKGFAELMKEGKSLSEVLLMLDNYAKKNNISLKDLFGQATAGKAALVLASEGGKEFNEILGEMENSAGATDKAFDKVNNTTGEKFKRSLNSLKNDAIRFGDAISPLMDQASSGISKISDKLGQLDDKQIQNIVSMGKFVVGAGVALKIGGKATKGIGGLLGIIGGLSGKIGEATLATKGIDTAIKGASLATGTAGESVGVFGSIMSGTTALMNPWVLGIGAATVGGIALAKHLSEDAIPAVDLFSSRISDSTKKNVGDFMELESDATTAMNEMNWSNSEATEEMTEKMTESIVGMKDTIVGTLEEQKEESLQTTKETLDGIMTITLEEKEQIMELEEQMYEDRITQTNHAADMILSIQKTASEEKRQLTEAEKDIINKLKSQMVEEGVRVLSKGEQEQVEILNTLKDQSGLITARQAAETVRNSLQQKRKTIRVAGEERDEKLRLARDLRQKGGKENIELANTIEAEAKRAYKASVSNAEKTHNEVVSEAKKQAGGHAKSIDWESGQVMSKWRQLVKWFKDNPVVRFFKTANEERVDNKSGRNSTGKRKPSIRRRWTGDRSFEGGLTYLHDRPGSTSTNYELYDLPRGTRIYNHDASQDLVMKTAEQVATKVANSVLRNTQSGSSGVTVVQHIYAKTDSPAEQARQSRKEYQKLTFTMG